MKIFSLEFITNSEQAKKSTSNLPFLVVVKGLSSSLTLWRVLFFPAIDSKCAIMNSRNNFILFQPVQFEIFDNFYG